VTETKAPSPHGFRVGDRVEVLDDDERTWVPGRYAGTHCGYLMVDRDDKNPAGGGPHGEWLTVAEEIRPSPAQPDEPQPGETWETKYHDERWRQVVILRKDEEYDQFFCVGSGIETVFARSWLIRRLSPQPTGEGQKEEPMPGETWQHSQFGAVLVEDNDEARRYPGHVGYRHPNGYETSCARNHLLRRLEGRKPKPCDHCDETGPHSHAFPADPYTQHRNANPDAVILQNMVSKEAYEAKRARFTADTLSDFDRKLPPIRNIPERSRWCGDSVVLEGRVERRRVAVGHPVHWPSAGDDEP
jgi:hypothetical protein